jgi:hypothetical protein
MVLTASIGGIAALALAAPTAAAGAVRYAEPGGNGPEPCRAANPCEIEVAVESGTVMDGDEVVLLPGDYALGAENLEITDDIDLHGQGGRPRPRILSSAEKAVSTNGTGAALIRDLEIEHTGSGIGILYAVTVERVEVTTTDGLACAPFFQSTIRDSICRSSGGALSVGLGVSAGGGTPVYDFRAVNVTAVGKTYGISLSTNSGPEFAIVGSNVIAQGANADVRVDTDASSDADVVLDNSNYDSELEQGDPDATVTDPGSASNQTAAPLFRDAASGDLHQLPGSPTRNAGVVTAGLGALDVDREPRAQEAAPDIGADEFDLLAPDTRITKGPRKLVRTRRRRAGARFRFTADDPLARFQCKLDRRAWAPCSSPFRRKVRARPGSGARHTLRVRAIDTWGNVEPLPAVRRWRVIRIRP